MIEFENNNTKLTETYIGIVLDINKEKRYCYVFIPRLMMGLPDNIIVNNEYPIENFNIINKTELNLAKSITKTNVLKVYSEDIEEPMPLKGSLVQIYFLDGNPRYGYWEKFNPNGKYQVIEEERYPKRFTIQLNNKIIEVNDTDTLKINIPEDYKITYEENEKIKTINILDNKELSNSLYNLKQYVQSLQNNVEFIVKMQKNTTSEKILNNYQSLVAKYSDKTFIQATLDYILIRLQYLEKSNLTLEEIIYVSTEIEQKIKTIEELVDMYFKYCLANSNDDWDSKYGLLSNDGAKNEILYKYNKLINNDHKLLEDEIAAIKQKLNTLRTISVYFEDLLLQEKSNIVGTVFNIPNKRLLIDTYLTKYPFTDYKDVNQTINDDDITTIELNRKAAIENETIYFNVNEETIESSVGCVSIHSDPDISYNNQLSVESYIETQKIYLNIINIDFDVILIANTEDETKFLMAVVDTTEYHQNTKNNSQILPDKVELTITTQDGTSLFVKSAQGEIDEENVNGWVISTEELTIEDLENEETPSDKSYITFDANTELTITMTVNDDIIRRRVLNYNNYTDFITSDIDDETSEEIE